MKLVQRLFKLSENGTCVRTEVIAGLTTFVTMAYIIFVNPAVLATDFTGKPTGMDPQAVMLAGCAAAALATAIMGLGANYPIAQAPGMGNNYLFVSIIMGLSAMGVTEAWRMALGMVFLSGIICVLLSLFSVRKAVIEGLSPGMRSGISVGIGLFITFIGLRNAGLVVDNPGTLVSLNVHPSWKDLAVFGTGLILIAVAQARRIPGSILIGVLASTVLAVLLGKVAMPAHWFGLPRISEPTAFRLDILGALSLTYLPFIVMLAFTDLFDTVGTLVGVTERAGLMKNGILPRANRALVSDASSTLVGALLGTSTVTSYIESAAGVEQGGRTGLANLVTAALFLAALVLAPVVGMVASYPPATAPALIVVGLFMSGAIRHIAWDDITEGLPAFLVMLGIPLTFSIADGLALGLVSYPALKLAAGRGREVKGLMYVLALLMIAYFVFVRSRIG